MNLDPIKSNFRNDISPENLRILVNVCRPCLTQLIHNVVLTEIQNGSPLPEDSQADLVTHGTLQYKQDKVSKRGKAYVYFKLSSPECLQHQVTFLIFNYKLMRTIQSVKIGSTIALFGFHEMPRHTRYNLAYSIWDRDVDAKIIVLQKKQQPAATGDGAQSGKRGRVLTLFGHTTDDGGP